jgi:hypothetical protein
MEGAVGANPTERGDLTEISDSDPTMPLFPHHRGFTPTIDNSPEGITDDGALEDQELESK